MVEEIGDERHVVNDRYCGESLSVAQVLRICLCTDLSRWHPTCCCLLDRNHAFTPHKINEMSECGPIPKVRSDMPCAIAQKPNRVVEGDVPQADTLERSPQALGRRVDAPMSNGTR